MTRGPAALASPCSPSDTIHVPRPRVVATRTLATPVELTLPVCGLTLPIDRSSSVTLTTGRPPPGDEPTPPSAPPAGYRAQLVLVPFSRALNTPPSPPR